MEQEKNNFLLPLLITFCLILSGCASSSVSRDAASNVDAGVVNAQSFAGVADTNIADSYQNSSQATKGVLLGGTAGAVAGAFASGVGAIPGAATGAILGGSYGSYIDVHASLMDQLVNRGATVVVLGDQILIVIPSDRIFRAWTSTIKSQAYSTLNLVARYVNRYTKMLVKISVYTNNTGSRRVDVALSQEQANQIEKFLVASGIDARVLYAVGCGGIHQVVANTLNWDSDNYRIEITLEKLYV